MQVKDNKELKNLLKLCREMGVDSIKVDNIEIVLGSAPHKQRKAATKEIPQPNPAAANDPFSFENVAIKYQAQAEEQQESEEPVELTEEQLLMWSTGSNETL